MADTSKGKKAKGDPNSAEARAARGRAISAGIKAAKARRRAAQERGEFPRL